MSLGNDVKLKVAIAGYGVVGKRRRSVIDDHPNLKTVAVCDQNFGKAWSQLSDIPSYPNYKELLAQSDLDILFVCLTNDIAAEVVIAGLERNLHVFCEKPPGKDLKDIEKVIQVERKYPKLKLKYGFNHRYHGSVTHALSILNEKKLGKILNMKGTYGKSAIIPNTGGWRSKREIAGGGILLDQGIHLLDLMRMFAGEFSEVYSFVHNNYWNHDVEDNAYALMKTPENVVAFLHSSATEWRHNFYLDITLEFGKMILSGILSDSKSYGEEKISIYYTKDRGNGLPNVENYQFYEDKSWEEEVKEFADCVINNREILYGSSVDALKTLQLVYKIYCADKKWKKLFHLTDELSKEFSY